MQFTVILVLFLWWPVVLDMILSELLQLVLKFIDSCLWVAVQLREFLCQVQHLVVMIRCCDVLGFPFGFP